MEIMIGNLVTGNYDIFCHQVNCMGVMGAGIARQIRFRYPEVYSSYIEKCKNDSNLLGKIQCIATSDKRTCVNFFSQMGYGIGRVYTDYEAFRLCLSHLKTYLDTYVPQDKIVAFPYGIGCGLAGGSWTVISKLLEDFSKTVRQKVIIVKFKK